MTQSEHLIEQHILRYESHLKQIDEMLNRARGHIEAGKGPPDAKEELQALENEREKLAGHLADMKTKKPEEWEEEPIERSGPMGIWDLVASRLEKLVERLD